MSSDQFLELLEALSQTPFMQNRQGRILFQKLCKSVNGLTARSAPFHVILCSDTLLAGCWFLLRMYFLSGSLLLLGDMEDFLFDLLFRKRPLPYLLVVRLQCRWHFRVLWWSRSGRWNVSSTPL